MTLGLEGRVWGIYCYTKYQFLKKSIIIQLYYTLFIYNYNYSTIHVNNYAIQQSDIGYEPAGLTVHPPPRMIEGRFIFFA